MSVTVMTIQFSKPVVFTDHTGVKFVNTTTSETAAPSLAAPLYLTGETSPSATLTYKNVEWTVDPAAGDVVTFEYIAAGGNYKDTDDNLMEDQLIELANCLGDFTHSIYEGTKTTDTTLRQENIATGVTAFLMKDVTGAGLVTIFIDGVSVGTVADSDSVIIAAAGSVISWSSTTAGTFTLGQGKT